MSLTMDVAYLQPGSDPYRGERTLAFANRLPGDDLQVTNGEEQRELLRLPFLPHREDQVPIFFLHCLVETDTSEVEPEVTVTTVGRRKEGMDPLLSVTVRTDAEPESIYAESFLREYEYTTGSFMDLDALAWSLSVSAHEGTATVSNKTTYGLLYEVE